MRKTIPSLTLFLSVAAQLTQAACDNSILNGHYALNGELIYSSDTSSADAPEPITGMLVFDGKGGWRLPSLTVAYYEDSNNQPKVDLVQAEKKGSYAVAEECVGTASITISKVNGRSGYDYAMEVQFSLSGRGQRAEMMLSTFTIIDEGDVDDGSVGRFKAVRSQLLSKD